METFWEAVTIPSPSPISPSLCKESGIPHQARKKSFPPRNAAHTVGVFVGSSQKGTAHRGPCSTPTEAEPSARLDPSEPACAPRKASFPESGLVRCAQPDSVPAPAPACGNTSPLPAPGARLPTPASRKPEGVSALQDLLQPRPLSQTKVVEKELRSGDYRLSGSSWAHQRASVSSLVNETPQSVKSLPTLQLSESELDPASRTSPHPHLSARTRPLRLPSGEWAPYPQRQPRSPRRTTERRPAAPCSPSRTSRRAPCPELGRRFFLPGPAGRRRRGGGTRAAAQDCEAQRGGCSGSGHDLQGRLRVPGGEEIPAALQLWAFCAQVMPRAGRGNTTIHRLLSRGPGTQCRVGAEAETLELGGGVLRGGAGAGLPSAAGPASQPGTGPGSPAPLANCVSPSPRWPGTASGPGSPEAERPRCNNSVVYLRRDKM